MGRNRIDIAGHRFGRLVAVSRADDHPVMQKTQWNCVCDCGATVVCVTGSLRSGNTQSCGCFSKDVLFEANFKHGRNKKDPTYGTWCAMKARCGNPSDINWKYYGSRGIKICERWMDFNLFLSDMGPRPDGMTIDRIDVNGDYEPSNCRWATDKEQARNKRDTKLIEFDGKKMMLCDWAEHLGLTIQALMGRLKSGWSIERALSTPVIKSAQRNNPKK